MVYNSKYWSWKFLARWFGACLKLQREREIRISWKVDNRSRPRRVNREASKEEIENRSCTLSGMQVEIGLFVLWHPLEPCRFININTCPEGAPSKQFYSSQSRINPTFLNIEKIYLYMHQYHSNVNFPLFIIIIRSFFPFSTEGTLLILVFPFAFVRICIHMYENRKSRKSSIPQ